MKLAKIVDRQTDRQTDRQNIFLIADFLNQKIYFKPNCSLRFIIGEDSSVFLFLLIYVDKQ